MAHPSRVIRWGLVAFAVGCGAVEPGPTCSSGLLIVPGPVSSIQATFPELEPSEGLAHLPDPPMRLGNSDDGCRRSEGCVVFVPLTPGAPELAIKSWIVPTNEPVCPLRVVLRP